MCRRLTCSHGVIVSELKAVLAGSNGIVMIDGRGNDGGDDGRGVASSAASEPHFREYVGDGLEEDKGTINDVDKRRRDRGGGAVRREQAT
jgi:hypothetical protein